MSVQQGLIGYRRFLQGDSAALENTVRFYSDALVRFALHYVQDPSTAEDIMENAFVALVVKRKKFDEEEQLRAYLYKTVRNECLSHLRGKKHLASLDENADKLLGYGVENEVLRRERQEVVRKALEKLPKQYEEVLILSYYNGLNVQELCDSLGKSEKQIYNLIGRARASLKKQLESYFDTNMEIL